ncbi:MAG TPA: hypothetical protein EYH31_06815 [Anaerolineae bacterium]|nr:hypothetical protein [Anaerolineae bacterium]
MSLEGLQAVLEKAPIIGTQAPERLLDAPAEVEDAYLRHVRTYVPLGHYVKTEETAAPLSIPEYERRLITYVKDKRAPKGYIAGEFGYGKTSTACFLWDRCRQVNLLAIPPFRLAALEDILTAVYGWARWELSRRVPALVDTAAAIYNRYVDRSLAGAAERLHISLADLEKLHAERRLRLELSGPDYVNFLEEMTALVEEAGYDGLVVLADEVQQYIEPEIKAGKGDPIAPLFDVINTLLTRRNHLACGLILVVPNKELGVINDQRRDLVDRLNADGLGLRLEAIYDQNFPARLWERLAEQFDFQEHADKAIAPETLAALGQIAMREDLASGPRTVVDVFKLVADRYLHGNRTPYTPLDLMDDFLAKRVSFGTDKLQQVVNDALASGYVQGRPEYERAVRLLAAFPQEGCPRDLQERYGVAEAMDDLANLAQGNLIIFVGGGYSSRGERIPIGATIRGLEKVEIDRDWIHRTVREFTRTYYETNNRMVQRAKAAFLTLLRRKAFAGNSWKVVQKVEASRFRNAGLLLEGAYSHLARTYPARRVFAQVIGPGEEIHPHQVDCDLTFQFVLRRHLDLPMSERRRLPGHVELEDERTVRLELNIMHRDEEGIYRDLHQALQPVVNPYKMSPLLMLALHEYIEEKRRANLIPKADEQIVVNLMQPSLLEHSFEEMLNPELGQRYGVAQERLLEHLFAECCQALFPDYHTLMVIGPWRSALGDYRAALRSLANPFQRQGVQNVSGTKDEIAKRFNRSHTGLDTLFANFPDLVEVVQKFGAHTKGVIRFTLHPLEKRIRELLATSPHVRPPEDGEKPVHWLPYEAIWHDAAGLGYREEELDAILELMEDRGLVVWERDKGRVAEAHLRVPAIDDLEAEARTLLTDIDSLATVLSGSQQLQRLRDDLQSYLETIARMRQSPEEAALINLRQLLQTARRSLERFVEDSRRQLLADLRRQEATSALVDDRVRANLAQPVTGAVDYTRQVNNLRHDLLGRYNEFATQVEELRAEINAAVAAAQAPLSIEELREQIEALSRREATATLLKGQQRSLSDRYQQYSRAVMVVQRGSQLLNDLQALGREADEVRGRFDALALSINRAISDKGLDALHEVPAWEQELTQLTQQVSDLKHAASDRFLAVQDAYRRLLRELQFSEQQMFSRRQYNPSDPAGSYQHLALDVQRDVRDFIATLLGERNLAGLRATLLQLTQATAIPADEAADIRAQAEALLKQVNQVDAAVRQLRSLADEMDRIRDLTPEGTGSFADLVAALKEQLDRVLELRREVEMLRHRLGSLRLTPAEQSVYGRLQELVRQQRITPDEQGYVELAELYRYLPRRSSDGGRSLLETLGDLYDKRRLRIKVGLVQEG